MSRKELRTRRSFLISGLPDNVRNEVASKIKALGGIYVKTDWFQPSCTHVICGRLSRGEKFLGACAMGKWILVPEYVSDSGTAGKWLAEEKYEWSPRWNRKGDHPADLLKAPSRWRQACASSKMAAFFNWKVAIIIDNAKRKTVYKRLLESGGAKVYKLPPLAKSSHILFQCLTHVLVNQDNCLTLESLVREGFPCYSPSYLGDFLIMDFAIDKKSEVIPKLKSIEINTRLLRSSSQSSKTSSEILSSSGQELLTPLSNSIYCSLNDTPVSSKRLTNKSCLNIFDSPQSISLFSSQNSGIYSSGVSPRLSPLENSFVSNRKLRQDITDPDRKRSKANFPDTSDCFVSSLNVTVKKPGTYSVTSSLKMEKDSSSIDTNVDSASNMSSYSFDSASSTKSQQDLNVEDVSVNKGKRCSVRLSLKHLSHLLQVSSTKSSINSLTCDTKASKSVSTNSTRPKRQTRSTPSNHNSMGSSTNTSSNSTRSSDLLLPGKYSDRSLTGNKTSRSSAGFTDWSNIREDSSSYSDCSSYSTSPSNFISETDDKGHVRITCKEEYPVSVKTKPVHIPARRSTRQKNLLKKYATEPMSKKSSATDTKYTGIICENDTPKATCIKKNKEKVFPTSSDISTCLSSSQCDEDQSSESKRSADQKGINVRNETLSDLSLKPAVRAVKREIFKTIDATDSNLSPKLQKLSHDPAEWRPTMFGVVRKRPSTAPQTDIIPTKKRRVMDISLPMNLASSAIVDTCLEDNYASQALDILFTMVSKTTFPQPRIMHTVMTHILRESELSHQSNRAYVFLRYVLSKHPPQPHKPAIRQFYLRSLRPLGTEECGPGTERQFITSIISSLVCCSEEVVDNPLTPENDILLLQYIVALLESDLANLIASKSDQLITARDLKKTLLGEIFWPSFQLISVDKHCKGMLDFMTESLELLKADQTKIVLVDLLLKIVSMLAQSIRISDQSSSKPNEILKGERISCLVYELSRRLSVMPESILNLTLARLAPAWLGLGVCSVLLDAMDDSLLQDYPEQGEITLTRIVTFDMYLLPALVRKPDSPIKTRSVKPRLSVTESNSGKSPTVTSGASSSCTSTPRSRGSVMATLNKVNKRNGKGEISLHTACRRNNVTRVKELLAIPGIDVNTGDNYGWTALHEASSRGNLGCVTELLKYKPPRTISSYFRSGETGNDRINLLAMNHEGVTALHDAVLNNRLEVAHVLLQYGGNKLLEAQTAGGDTPLSLCVSDEMRAILTTPGLEIPATTRNVRRAINMSQGSQDSESSFLFSQETSIERSLLSTPTERSWLPGRPPSLEMYQRILGEGTDRQYRSLEECLKYMCLLQHTVRLYVALHQLSLHALKRRKNSQTLVEQGKKTENSDLFQSSNCQNCGSHLLYHQSKNNCRRTPDKVMGKNRPSFRNLSCKCSSQVMGCKDPSQVMGCKCPSQVMSHKASSQVMNCKCSSQVLGDKFSHDIMSCKRSSDATGDNCFSDDSSCAFATNFTESNQLEADLQVYVQLGKYLEGLRGHLKQISRPEDYKTLKSRLIPWLCLCF